MHVASSDHMIQKSVLIVMEEPMVRALVANHFQSAGFFPMAVATVNDGRRLVSQVRPDVIVVDLDGADEMRSDGFDSLYPLSQQGHTSMVVLGSHVQDGCGEDERNLGASLCFAKPFTPSDLLAHISAQLVANAPSANTLRHGVLELDLDRHVATIRTSGMAHSFELSTQELKLLEFLVRNAHRVVSRDDILQSVWGEAAVDARTVDQCIRRLRRSFEQIDAAALIRTVHGYGYRIAETLTPPLSSRKGHDPQLLQAIGPSAVMGRSHPVKKWTRHGQPRFLDSTSHVSPAPSTGDHP
ncbi:response regulator transcription factor [Pseudorhodoferax sp. LjRoot39]|uniref:response regulator transcription factor n=1 Tax=Pseudorhodoferax sp. LjRoot39 TaxID=3342328 RepID=UPI003ED070EC